MADLRLEGEVDRDVAALLGEQLAQLTPADAPVRLDLSECDIEDARVVAAMVTFLRDTARRLGSVTVTGAPQALAHSLYRVNALNEGVTLVDPREEIGTSS